MATSGALVLHMTRHEDIGPQPSLWRVDEVRATLEDGTPAGYCRISYVPASQVADWDDIYGYLRSYGQRHGLSEVVRLPLPPAASIEQRERWAVAIRDLRYPWARQDSPERAPWANDAAVRAYLEQARPWLEEKFGKARQEFLDFHCDKPLVDYIRLPEALQGKRLARALYAEAARWMAQRGLQLHASGVQTPEAQRCWQAMAASGWVETAPDGRRRLRLS